MNISVEHLYEKHSFPLPVGASVMVLRETDFDLNYCRDNSTNSCDTVLLLSPPPFKLEHCLKGRSLPHKKYQEKMVLGKSRANYIASGYYRKAWRKGKHRGYPALVQNRSFVIYRSLDMDLKDDDDYPEYHTIVADNFHGWSPFSAGCVTVEGSMKDRSGDWDLAYNWIYGRYGGQKFFSVCILEHQDLFGDGILKVGSVGDKVRLLQRELGITADGDYGVMTHQAYTYGR